jgi:hypothetical protein
MRLSNVAVFVLAILAVPAILIALGLGLLMAEKLKLGWVEVPVHYRFTYGVEVGGIAYEGSTVTRVTYTHIPQWQMVNGPGIGGDTEGQASCVKIPDGRMTCLLPDTSDWGDGKHYYPGIDGLAPRLLSVDGSPTGPRKEFIPIYASNAATVSGSSEIPTNVLPPIIVLNDPSDPSSAHLFDPEHPERTLGPGARFLGARIAVTNEPVSRGIETMLPWLVRSKSSPEKLNDPGDPFLRGPPGQALYKQFFY